MGQGGQLQLALLFHGPLAFQGLGQADPQLLHGGQCLAELPHPGPAFQRGVQPLPSNGLSRSGQQGSIPPQQSCKMLRQQNASQKPGPQQNQNRAGLELGQMGLQALQTVRHRVVVLDDADFPCGQLHHPVVLGIENPVPDGIPRQGGFRIGKLPAVHVPRVHHLAAAVKDGPAVIVGDFLRRDGAGFQFIDQIVHSIGGSAGRVDKLHLHQDRQPQPPKHRQCQNHRACG